jgi:dTDP-glucose 4,6-dehydratase
VVREICDLLDARIPPPAGRSRRELITFVTDRPGHDRRYALDAGKIQAELGWRPRRSFGEGLAETVQWYLEHAEWVREVESGEYLRWIREQYEVTP